MTNGNEIKKEYKIKSAKKTDIKIKLFFDGKIVYLKDDNEQVLKKWSAYSGSFGMSRSRRAPFKCSLYEVGKDTFPIPEGNWYINTNEINIVKGRQEQIGWGRERVKIHPAKDNLTKRSGFYFHGGDDSPLDGTSGCIQIAPQDNAKDFFNSIRRYKKSIPLKVFYGCKK